MNKFMDRAKLFIQIQKTSELVEIYIACNATLPKRDREIMETTIRQYRLFKDLQNSDARAWS